MAGIRYTASARNDLVAITDFIAEDRPQCAAKLLREIEVATETLSAMPALGQARLELVRDESVRFWLVRDFMLIYRATAHELTVLRILHGKRNIAKALAEREIRPNQVNIAQCRDG